MTPVDPETRSTSGWLRWVALVLTLAALYVVTARLGLMLALPPENKATALWPPSGIALAALLLYGHRIWPGVWLGSFLANIWDGFNAANPFPLSAHLFVSAGIATGSTLQALAGNFLVRRWTGSVRPFQRAIHAFTFAGVTMFVCLIAATFGAASLYVAEFAPAKALPFIWWTWWLGDMTGVLTVGSLLLTWSRLPSLARQPRRLEEAALLLLLLSALASIVFGIVSPITGLPTPLAYLVIPFLVWATFRFGLHGATTSLVLVSALAVVGTAQGTGPFVQPIVGSSLLLLQIFMGVLSVTVLVMAAVLTERTQAEQALRESEARFTTLAAAVPGFLFSNLPDGWSDYTSRRFYEYTGMADGAADGHGWTEAVHPDDREGAAAHFLACMKERKTFEGQYRFREANGSYRWFFVRSVPLFNEQRQVVKWHGICTDIDEQVRAENALRELTLHLEQHTHALQESEDRLRSVFNASPSGLILVKADGRVVLANNQVLRMFGFEWGELKDRPVEELLPERVRDQHPAYREAYFAAPQVRAMGIGRDLKGRRRDGREFPVEVGLTPFEWQGERFVLASVIDITARKETEIALRLSEERFRSAFDYAPIGIALVAPDGKWLQVNRSLCKIVGYSEAELLAMDFQTITHPDDLEADLSHIRNMLAGTIQTYQMEKRYYHKGGHLIDIMLSVSLVRNTEGQPLYFIKQIQDISQRKQAGEEIRTSLREKEVLLKEIHHRVKNNLQIVATLLDLQSDHTQDRQALEMFKESRGRVKSMALVHERFYRSQDLARVNFTEYIRQLADDLYRTYKVSGEQIVLDVAVHVPPLAIDIAIPCGLLLNELLSNCFKHAFKDATQGTILVTLSRDGTDTSILTVADDGVGFPHDLDFRCTTSFGMQLVNTLAEQLHGEITLTSQRGTAFTVTFPDTR